MQNNQGTDLKLIKQLYSRLNIGWAQKPNINYKNPILHRPQTNMMAKSIAHKFFNSKRYKLSQSKPANKSQQSQHVFTNSGIVNICGRKFSQQSSCKTQPKENYPLINFQKYEKSPLFIISNQTKHSRTHSINDMVMAIKQKNNEECYSQTARKTNRSFRAKQAHFSERKQKKENQLSLFRKSSQNWNRVKKRKQQKFDVNGWEIQIDQNDINYHEFRMRTEL